MMQRPSYRVIISKKAAKAVNEIPAADALRIYKLILALADNPFPVGYKKLEGFENRYRIRSGVYRIIYSIDKGKLIIMVLAVGHRKDIYER
jgi:mRNA interferase RelE/StbE